MRKWIMLLTLVGILILPTMAQAQGGIVFSNLSIQLWPEFDQPSMLVIYDFNLDAATPLPAKVTIRIPARTELLALARSESGNLFTIPSDPPVTQGDWKLITFTVNDLNMYRVEFYDLLARNGDNRSYLFEWPGDYAIKNFNIKLQEPIGATNMQTTPALTDIGPELDGFVYYRSTQSDLPAGQAYTLSISYNKANDELSINRLPQGSQVQPVGDLGAGRMLNPEVLPWLLGGFGLLLILGGGLWYWQSSRASSTPMRRKRHVRHTKGEDRDNEPLGDVYCHQCGKRTQAADRFCRACGTRLRRDE